MTLDEREGMFTCKVFQPVSVITTLMFGTMSRVSVNKDRMGDGSILSVIQINKKNNRHGL